jgi:hypothetical protein
LLALALIPGGYAFNYFCGCVFGADPVTLQVDTLDKLNIPPIAIYTKGAPPQNVTFLVSTGALADGEPLTVYQYWFFWQGCQLNPTGPLCLIGHSANAWEPLYLYWKTTNPTSPVLLAAETRTHFVWRQTAGSQIELNGTQPVIKFALSKVTILGQSFAGFVPTLLSSGPIVTLLGANATVTYPFTNSTGLFSQSNFYYPVTNGGPHTLQLFQDPNSPPSSGPNAYEPGAAPADPFYLYGSGRNLQVGFLIGAGVTFAFYLLFTVGLYEERAVRAWIRKQR